MKLFLRKTEFLCFAIYMIFIPLLFLLIDSIAKHSYTDWLNEIVLFIGLILVIHLCFLWIAFGKLLTFNSILLVCSYVFHLSYPLVLLKGKKDADFAIYTLRQFSDSDFVSMTVVALKYIIVLFAGMLFANMFRVERHKYRQEVDEFTELSDVSFRYYRNLGIICIVIGLPLDSMLCMIKLLAMLKGGYIAAIETASVIKSYDIYLAYLLLIGVFLLWNTTNDERKKKRYMLSYCLYEVIWMFSGQRAQPLISIIICLWLYYGFASKINLKKILRLVVIGYLGIVVLVFIRTYRLDGFNQIDIGSMLMGGSVLFNSLAEFGMTICVVGFALTSSIPHALGSGVVYNVLFAIPGISALGLDLEQWDMYEQLQLNSWGASYIAEILYDFKHLGLLMIFIYGIYVTWLSRSISNSIKAKNFKKTIYLIPLAVMTVFCVRTGLRNLSRTFIWTSIIITIVNLLVKKKREK